MVNPATSTPSSMSATPLSTADVWSNDASTLSPDALMAYCQSRLDSIDGQVKQSFKEQSSNANTIQQIDQLASQLKEMSKDINDNKTGACTQLEAKVMALVQNIRATDPGCSQLPALTQAYNTLVYSGDGGANYRSTQGQTVGGDDPDYIDQTDYPPDKSSNQGDGILTVQADIQPLITSLTDAASNLNSESELRMVQLQSLMSQRQTAITLTTNLVQSLGDQMNKVVDNIGK